MGRLIYFILRFIIQRKMIFSGLFFVSILVTITVEINGHGYLTVPPARNCMWRFGYDNPINYNDNELFCGGYEVQYGINGGKCGVCGDDYRLKVPRPHEDGGEYGNGIIGRTYTVGQQIQVSADLVANHMGWMSLKICPRKPGQIVTQECFDKYPLKIVGEDSDKFVIPSKEPQVFTFSVQLPEGMTCSQCVIQWYYFAGNNWGTCEDGTEGMGCGPQETFVNCADVAISAKAPLQDEKLTPVSILVSDQLCIPVEEHRGRTGLEEWCKVNCLKFPRNCPAKFCKCVNKCVGIGEFAKEDGADLYCDEKCLKYSSFCPADKCQCS